MRCRVVVDICVVRTGPTSCPSVVACSSFTVCVEMPSFSFQITLSNCPLLDAVWELLLSPVFVSFSKFLFLTNSLNIYMCATLWHAVSACMCVSLLVYVYVFVCGACEFTDVVVCGVCLTLADWISVLSVNDSNSNGNNNIEHIFLSGHKVVNS